MATAIHAKADLIITFNLKDFPQYILKNYHIEAIQPDEFILELIDINETAVIQAANQQRDSLKNPPFTKDEYLQSLTNQRLTQTAEILRTILLP